MVEELTAIFGEPRPSPSAVRQLVRSCQWNINEAANVYFLGKTKTHASDAEESTVEQQGRGLELFINTCLDDTLPWAPLNVDRHEPIFPQAMTLYKRPNFDFGEG